MAPRSRSHRATPPRRESRSRAPGCWGPAATSPGFELFNSQQLGASDFQQQITYQRALEGQLDQTIDQIQGVDSAQVNLVLPNPQEELFASTAQSASASVLLDSSSLNPGSVQGIAQMVASSVPSLDVNKVTITDQTGQLLWPTSNGSGASASGLLSKQSAQQAYDATTAAQVTAVLNQTLGPGKADVQVNADLNTNQATSDSLTYASKGVPLTQQTSSETLTGTGGTGGKGRHRGQHPRIRRNHQRQLQLQEHDREHDLWRRQDRYQHDDCARRDQQPERVGAGRQVGARRRSCRRSAARSQPL